MKRFYTDQAIEELKAHINAGRPLSYNVAEAVLAYALVADRRGIEYADALLFGPGGTLEDHRADR